MQRGTVACFSNTNILPAFWYRCSTSLQGHSVFPPCSKSLTHENNYPHGSQSYLCVVEFLQNQQFTGACTVAFPLWLFQLFCRRITLNNLMIFTIIGVILFLGNAICSMSQFELYSQKANSINFYLGCFNGIVAVMVMLTLIRHLAQ